MSKNNNKKILFDIQRIYTKDISFEAPNAPQIFQQEWKPKIKLDLYTTSNQIFKDVYEVTLHITVTALIEENTAFLCEVKQAGIFTISGFDNHKMKRCLGSYCPDILFPYARECISNQITRGSFPQINLSPVNFEALFINYLKKQNIQKDKKEK